MAFTPDEALSRLTAACEQQRLGHAYLITGPAGAGKRELARELCRLLTARPAGADLFGEAAPDDASADPFEHQDVHIAQPESKTRRIVIDQIRDLERELRMRSLTGGRKVGVIFDADRLTEQAANAFLKTLEEPPENSHLILVSAHAEQMIETILSRCIEVPLRAPVERTLSPLQQRLLTALREFSRIEHPDLPHIFGLARTFQTLLAEAKEEISSETNAAFKAEEKTYKQTTGASSSWFEDREEHFKAVTESRYQGVRATLVAIIDEWWADALRSRHGGKVDHPDFAADTSALAARFSDAVLLRKHQALSEMRDHLARGGGVPEQLAIECGFLRIFGES